MSFAPDGTLWAITSGGLVRWNLDADTYTRYLLDTRDMAAAPDGTLWLATEQGLCHFDGIRCEQVSMDEGLRGEAVLAIAVTAEGVVWAGGEWGVSRFDGEGWHHYPSKVPTVDLAVGIGGEVWAATPRGLGRYLPAQDTWLTYTDKDGMPGLQATMLAVAPDGDIWVNLAWQGLYRFDGEAWQAVQEAPGGLVSDVAFVAGGTPWVATYGSLHYPGGALSHWNGSEWVDVTSAYGLTSISAVAADPEGMLAAGTSLGLAVYQGGAWRLLRDGPLSERVTSVAVTPDGGAWFGFGDYSVSTTGGGLSRFDGREWSYFLDDKEVSVLAVAPDGALWAGVGCSVLRFDDTTWETVAHCEDLPLGNISDIDFAQDGAAWVANGFGLARFDGESWLVYDRLANSLVAAPDGAVWVNGWEGTQGSDYVARFDGQDWMAYRSADAFPGRFVAGVVTPDGLVWGIVPERGLASFDGGSWTQGSSWAVYTPPEGISLDGSLSLTVAPDGALWMRTAEGAARFDPAVVRSRSAETALNGTWTLYTVQHPLCSSSYRPIAFGPQGEVWFGTSRFLPVAP